jgi:hypothetical protein
MEYGFLIVCFEPTRNACYVAENHLEIPRSFAEEMHRIKLNINLYNDFVINDLYAFIVRKIVNAMSENKIWSENRSSYLISFSLSYIDRDINEVDEEIENFDQEIQVAYLDDSDEEYDYDYEADNDSAYASDSEADEYEDDESDNDEYEGDEYDELTDREE